MKRIVWKYGLIAGAMLSVMMAISMAFIDEIGDRGYVVGYATMVLSFLMVYFGIRSYRDTVGRGAIGFGRAAAVGILITVIGSLCYTATWEVIYYKMMPDFGEKYAANALAKAKAAGATPEALEAQRIEGEKFVAMYKNPVANVALTFIEPFPVGLVIALLCAAVLRRREGSPDEAAIPSRASPA